MDPLHHGLSMPHAAPAQVMHAAGFRVIGDALVLPPDASLPALTCLLARLRRIASQKGHSGDAEFFPLPGGSAGGAGGASPYLVSNMRIGHSVMLCTCAAKRRIYHDHSGVRFSSSQQQTVCRMLHTQLTWRVRLSAEHARLPVPDRHPPLHAVRPSHQRRQRAPVHRVV